MSLLVPEEGRVQILTDLLCGQPTENWVVGLHTSPLSPSVDDTLSVYTALEASFTGYSRKTLFRACGADNWSVPILRPPTGWSNSENIAFSQYGASPLTWACTSAGEVLYGYFIFGAVSGKLIAVDLFSQPRAVYNGATILFTPSFGTDAAQLAGPPPPAQVTGYTLTGPSTIGTNAGYDYYATLGSGVLNSTVRVTFSDGGAGGTFTPQYLDLTNSARSGSVSYSISGAANLTISTTNNGSLTQSPAGGLAVTADPQYSQGGSGFLLLF